MPVSPVEDLNNLSLGNHPLAAAPPFLIERDEEPEFIREFFRVQWRANDPIDFYVIRPSHAAKPPVTIFLYGFPSESDRFRDNGYCRQLTARGYAAIGFVSAMTGQRFHDRGLDEWFVSQLHDALVMSVHDVQMAVDYIDTRSDLDGSRVSMFGQGSGGAIAVLAASVDPRLKRIDLMDPWGDWPKWLAGSAMILDDERPKLTTPLFLEDVADIDPVKVLPRLAASRVHLQDVLYDRDTPPEAKRAIETAMPSGSSIERYATREEFQSKALEDARMLNWLQPREDQGGETSSAGAASAGDHHQRSAQSIK